MKISELDEGVLDFFFGSKEKELKDNPEYKGWLKVYLKNPDIAQLHKKHKEFLAYYNQSTSKAQAGN